jgi:hypothetical protein
MMTTAVKNADNENLAKLAKKLQVMHDRVAGVALAATEDTALPRNLSSLGGRL